MQDRPRLTSGCRICQVEALDRQSLAAINAYSPGLSGAWMLQRAMSVRPGSAPAPQFINALLGANFQAMEKSGEATLKPFLQVRMSLHSSRYAAQGRAVGHRGKYVFSWL